MTLPGDTRWQKSLGAWLLLAGLVGVAFGVPSVTTDLLLVDLAFVLLMTLWGLRLLRGDLASVSLGRPLVLPLGLIAVGSLLGATNMGFSFPTVNGLIRDVGAFATFLAALDLYVRFDWRYRRAATWVIWGTVIVVGGHLALFGDAERPAATFENPNLAAHFVATALIACLLGPLHRWARWSAIAIGGLGILASGSFGALVQIGASVVVGVGFYLKRRGFDVVRLSITFGAVIAMAALFAVALLPSLLPQSQAARFDRSATTRLELWSGVAEVVISHPLGIGPANTAPLAALPSGQEAHSDYVAYLIERSVVGLVGLVLLWWRMARYGPRTFTLVAGLAVSGLAHEVMHFRHIWPILALVVVTDVASRRTDASASIPVTTAPAVP